MFVCPVLAEEAETPINYVFENFQDMMVSDWDGVGDILADGNTIEVKKEENGNKYLHYTLKNPDSGAQFAYWDFEPVEGIVTISMDIIRYDANSESRPHLLNSFRGDILPFEFLKEENGQCVVDAIQGNIVVDQYEIGKWVNYIIVIDTNNDTEDIYVDGELALSIENRFTDFMQFRFHQRNLATGTTAELGLDNIQVIRGNAVDELINAYKNGKIGECLYEIYEPVETEPTDPPATSDLNTEETEPESSDTDSITTPDTSISTESVSDSVSISETQSSSATPSDGTNPTVWIVISVVIVLFVVCVVVVLKKKK